MVKPMLKWMAADPSIISASATYIRIESIAKIFELLTMYIYIVFVTLDKRTYLVFLTILRLILSISFDSLFISSLPVSLRLGINGIGYANIAVNVCILIVSAGLLKREEIVIFTKNKPSFRWMKDFIRIGGLSGMESFVRNAAYLLMILRMVNMVNEQGLYWVANGFIWSWLLLPVTQLGELIKQEVSTERKNIKYHTVKYLEITACICIFWVISMPLWKIFMRYVLGYAEVEKLFGIAALLAVFYIFYAFQNVFDATFYGAGKTNYMFFESVVTNGLYYGTAFILYLCGLWKPTLNGIVFLFGFGIIFDSIVSFIAYIIFLHKEKAFTNKKSA